MEPYPFTPSPALVAFEAFVQAQKPASEPWTPVTDYSFATRQQVEGPRPKLIKEVFDPQSVLDVGCGTGALMALLRAEGIPVVRGCDKQYTMDTHGEIPGAWRADITSSPRDFMVYQRYDLVICREVLEHLTVLEITKAVKNLVRASSKYIYLTTRFNQTPRHLLDVQDHDDLDPTHITLMSRDLLRLLFVLEGCTSRFDLEAQMDWGPVGRSMVFEVPQ